MAELGERISECRQNVNMTQEELAAKLGVTAQAVSKWERRQSYPDIFTFAQLCKVLHVSADLLLETECNNFSETNNSKFNDEIRRVLRLSEEPLALIFGEALVELFMKQPYEEHIEKQRKILAGSGILMPLVRIKDEIALYPKEFMILSYHRVLYSEQIEVIAENTLQYMTEKLAQVVKDNYGYILNRDIVRNLIDNLQIEYPALITGVVPEKISYGMLQKVLTGLLERGDGLCYMVKTIEIMEEELKKNPDISVDELVHAVANEIEHEDNFWVVMRKRDNEILAI